MVDQLYVEQIVPQSVKQKYPLIFWHGVAQTGTVSSPALSTRIASKITPEFGNSKPGGCCPYILFNEI